MTVRDLIAVLDALAGPELAEEWDNVGLMVGDPGMEVEGVLVALDPTAEILQEASEKGCNVVVTHHPLIFKALRSIRPDQPEGAILAAALNDSTAIIACHTNLDKIAGGVSDMLATRLGLHDTRVLVAEPRSATEDVVGFGRIGDLASPLSGTEFFRLVREALLLPVLKVAGPLPPIVHRVAVCGGSGSELAAVAWAAGAQIYISGEMKHSVARWAESVGFCLLDGGHFATENPMVPELATHIRKALAALGATVEVLVATSQVCPFRYYDAMDNVL